LLSRFAAGDGKGEQGMKALTLAAALLALAVLPAEARMAVGGGMAATTKRPTRRSRRSTRRPTRRR
jgi:hypothetical protein